MRCAFPPYAAEAALPQKIGLEVVHQLSALGLRRCPRRSCRHSDFKKMRNEQPGKIRDLDLALQRGGQSPSQFAGKTWRQRRRRNALDIEQAAEASKQITIIRQGLRFVVPG